jgi:hypothetical protein
MRTLTPAVPNPAVRGLPGLGLHASLLLLKPDPDAPDAQAESAHLPVLKPDP